MTTIFQQLVNDYFIDARIDQTPADWVIDCIDCSVTGINQTQLIEQIYSAIDSKTSAIEEQLERLELQYRIVCDDVEVHNIKAARSVLTLYAESWTGYAEFDELLARLGRLSPHDQEENLLQIKDACCWVDNHGA